jgi:hypothetical protein
LARPTIAIDVYIRVIINVLIVLILLYSTTLVRSSVWL